ncbi:MAG: hypothetical protein ACLTEH_03690 [Clostridia bacterium]
MEKKKRKIGKTFLIIFLIILVIIIVLIARKVIIMNSIQNKIAKYQNSTNIYVKTVSDRSLSIESFEKYIKGDIEKDVIIAKDKPVKVIQIITPTERRNYTISEEKKVLNITQDENIVTTTRIVNYVESSNLIQTILNSLFTRITTEKIEGKTYYVVSGYLNGFLYTQDTIEVKAYIDKETGLTMKIVEIVKENGEKKAYAINYTYQLDCVTDQDMQEPDRSEYIVQENGTR